MGLLFKIQSKFVIHGVSNNAEENEQKLVGTNEMKKRSDESRSPHSLCACVCVCGCVKVSTHKTHTYERMDGIR